MLIRQPARVFFALLILSLTLFLARYAISGNCIWGDGRYYYAFVRSWVIDRDIDFSNERLVDPFYFDDVPTPIGRVGNKYSIGTPLMWLPGFVSAHLVSLIGEFLGLPLKPDGYGHLYRIFIGIDSVAYGIAGLFLAYLVTAKLTRPTSALIATLTIALGSHLFYYLSLDPANSHPPSVFISSLILFTFLRLTQHQTSPLTLGNGHGPKHLSTQAVGRLTPIYLIALGLLTGLLAMIRNHDLIFALPTIIWVLFQPLRPIPKIKLLSLFIFSLGIGFSLYLLTVLKLYGTLTSPYLLLGESFTFSRLQIIPILFSSNNGLFLFSPILLLSIFGLWSLSRSKHFIGLSGLILFLVQTVILSSWSGWWGGESFGGRMFLSLTPYFILGLAHTLSRLKTATTYTLTLSSIIFTQALVLHFLLAR